jgi:hypothetical protein
MFIPCRGNLFIGISLSIELNALAGNFNYLYESDLGRDK